MGIQSSGCPAVDAIGRIVITGNVIPPKWYKEIKKENGRTDHLAVSILSDIVYWYRPVEVRDEATGYVIGLRKKFKGDLLQKTYDQYAQFFDEKKRIIKEAMDRLEKQGLIRRIFRDITLESGLKLPNVMYIEIFPDRIREITEEDITPVTSGPSGQKLDGGMGNSADGIVDNSPKTAENQGFVGYPTKNRTTPCENPYDLPQNSVPPLTENDTHIPRDFSGHPTPVRGTNTENTTETTYESTTGNTTEINNGEYDSPVMSCPEETGEDEPWMGQENWSRPIKVTMMPPKDRRTDREIYIEMLQDQVDYDAILGTDCFRDQREILDGIINIIADIATTNPPDGNEWVNGRPYPHEVVKSRLLKMDYDTVTHVLSRLKANTTRIKNVRSYLLTSLYNAKDEKELQFENVISHDFRDGYWHPDDD